MKTAAIVVGLIVAGYLVGAFGGGALITLLSANAHDRSVEAAMTGAFVTGPLGAVVALIGGLALRRRGAGPKARS